MTEPERTADQRDTDATDRDVAAALRDKLGDEESPGERQARHEAAQDRFAAMQDRGDARRDRGAT